MNEAIKPTHMVKVWGAETYNNIHPGSYVVGSKRPAIIDNDSLGYKVLSEFGEYYYFSNCEVELVGTIKYEA